MFGWRKEISNLECDIIAVEGYLSGLNYRLNSLIKLSNSTDYRGDLTDEIKRVEEEIEKTNIKLVDLKNSIS
jgi:hypothetical protein